MGNDDYLRSQYLNYDPENDPSGAIGHSLADRALKASGGQQNLRHWLNKNAFDRGYDVGQVTRIALRPFSDLQRGEVIGVIEIKQRLREIRDGGYPIEAYSSMNKKRVQEYLSLVQSNIRKEARFACPNVLEEVSKISDID